MRAVGCIALGIVVMPREYEVGLAMPIGGGPCRPILEPIPDAIVFACGLVLGAVFYTLPALARAIGRARSIRELQFAALVNDQSSNPEGTSVSGHRLPR